MQKLAALCVRRPVLASVLILILVVVGAAGFFRLGVDRFPQVDLPTVSINTSLPGAAPETVETEVTDKIEQGVNTIAGVDELRSSSTQGSSSVTVTFTLETNIDVATQEVRDQIALIQRQLPLGIDPPTVRRFDPNQTPVLAIVISGQQSVGALTDYANQTLEPLIETAGGVGQAQLRGDRARQINIHLDAFKMRSYNITTPDVVSAIQAQNVEVPGGRVEQSAQTLTLRTLSRFTSPAQFNRVLLLSGNGQQVHLSDVARVEDGLADETTGSEFNGKRAVQMAVYKQSGTNTLQVIQAVTQKLELARKSAPSGVTLSVVRSQQDFIQAAVTAVEEHLVLGSILASLVVLVFLWNWRSTLIASIAIPTSIISTFGLIWAMGFTLNVITLLALTLAVGIVIDDAIVVLENIYRLMEEKHLPPMQAAIEGTQEIGFAVMATTLSLIAVFLPVAFMTGIVGRFLASFGLTMSFAILVSLLVSFTLTPMLASRWLGKNRKASQSSTRLPADSLPLVTSHNPSGSTRQRGFYGYIDRFYTVLLKWSMANRWVVSLVCLSVMFAIPLLWKMLPYNFLPDEDESQFQVSMEMAPGTSLAVTRAAVRKIDARVRKSRDVQYTLMTAGAAGFGAGTTNQANIFVGLKPIEDRKLSQTEIVQKMRRSLRRRAANLGMTTFRVSPINSFSILSGGGRGGGNVQYVLSGTDLDGLQKTAQKAIAQIDKIPGVADATTSFEAGAPEVQAVINRDEAGDAGVSPLVVANTLNYLVGGQKVTDYLEGGYEYEVHIRADASFRSDASGIGQLTVPSNPSITAASSGTSSTGNAFGAGSSSVPLNQVVDFKRSTGPSQIDRYNRRRQVTISANVVPGASEANIGRGIEAVFAGLKLDPSYVLTPSGTSREQQRTNAAFIQALALSFIFMYLILAAQFESWLHPITILLTLPLTIPFALLSLILFGQSLNIFSLLGILVLFGVVKKNAILQIDHTNQLRDKGMNRLDAIIAANRDRLRPILMTTLAFVAGMIPLVFSHGAGSGTNRAIGTVIFGGQSLSLLLTLLAVPVIYSLFDDAASSVAKLRRRLGFGEDAIEEPASGEPVSSGQVQLQTMKDAT